MPTDNKSIVRRLYEEVWNKRRLEVADELLSPSHAAHGPNVSGSAVGPKAYKRQVTQFLTGLPDLRLSIEDTVGEKEKVVVSWNISGTHKGEFMGIPPTNRKISIDGITINHIADGKIMDSYISYDALSILRQLGVAQPIAQPNTLAAH